MNEHVFVFATICWLIFFIGLFSVVVQRLGMFFKKHGRMHRLLGLLYLSLLLLGLADCYGHFLNRVFYDVFLPMLGTALSLTAAFEFRHKNVKNVASGALDPHATISWEEMIEHAWYEALNIAHAIFLHLCRPELSLPYRFVLLVLITAPWLTRHQLPINKFSDNYTKLDPKSTELVRFLYRLKKYQYVLYKNLLLHGLNISLVLSGVRIVDEQYFRFYWISLNTSYVMEFFTQTLVKRSYMRQQTLLILTQILMLEATSVAVFVLWNVNLSFGIASIVLNFVNRKHDFTNSLLLFGLGCGWALLSRS